MASFFTIFLLFVWASSEVYSQLCADRNTKTLIKIPYIPHRGIDTCTAVADYSTYLTSLLDTCTFTTVAGVTESGTCHTECVTDDTCIGFVFSSANVCELCIVTTGNGNGNSYAQADVMIVLEALNNHINGEHLCYRRMQIFLRTGKIWSNKLIEYFSGWLGHSWHFAQPASNVTIERS